MTIHGRQILFWRKPSAEVSRFATVLPRIRTIREEFDWQPLSSAAATQQRRERVQSARRRIIYHPVPYDRGLEWRLPLRRTWWLWLAGGFAVLSVVALIWGLAFMRRERSEHTFRYPLSTPANLSEQLALEKAKASLSNVVSDAHLWQPDEFLEPQVTADGTLERHFLRLTPNAGMITFGRPDRTNLFWIVYVETFGQDVQCTVQSHTINKK